MNIIDGSVKIWGYSLLDLSDGKLLLCFPCMLLYLLVVPYDCRLC